MRRSTGGTRKKAGSEKRTTKKRSGRRVGAAGNMGNILSMVGGLVLGGGAGRELATLLGKFLPTLVTNQMLDGAIQAGVGYFLPKVFKGNTFITFLGYGMIASGGQTILVGTGLISGIGNTMSYRIGGTSNLRVINGTGNLKVVGAPGDNRIQNQPTVGAPVRARNFNNHG